MITIDEIFRIPQGDPKAFEAAALELFRLQAATCPPYGEYLNRIGIQKEQVKAFRQIPFLPIELFKSHEVYCEEVPPEAVFTSSATTGMVPSRHPMRSLALYERAFRGAFRTFGGGGRRGRLPGPCARSRIRSGREGPWRRRGSGSAWRFPGLFSRTCEKR